MKKQRRWFCWWLTVAVSLFLAAPIDVAKSDPQINLLNKGCSQYNATNLSNFFSNLNTTFRDLRGQLSAVSTHFATAQQARSSDPVYGMAQCRNYLTVSDCLACFDAAVSQIRNCSAANGARVIYDGCFLRYESNGFYDQTTLPGNVGICSNQTSSDGNPFDAAALKLLSDLRAATPRINGFFAASTAEVSGSSGPTVYAVAQCTETVSPSGCQDCLNVAYGNIQSCPPDSNGRAIDAGCFMRYSETSFFPANATTNIAAVLGGGGSTRKKAIIGGAVGGVAFLLLLAALATLYYRISRKSTATQRGNVVGASELRGPRTYRFKDLKAATNNFGEEVKLGEGGFGDVYKGVLKDGTTVAVKRLTVAASRGKAEFESEVRVISNVHHRNLIRLLGCCSKGPELLLVLEYMANGSLDKFLYGEKRGALNWKQRFDIIFGMARGLAYLHEQYHVTIIHRDIKSSNILLDDGFQPKIADFGLARLLPEDQTHVNTRFAGTLGYTAPEYAIQGQLSEKVDTYSFGIVVLEIVSGRRCTDVQTEPPTEYLLEQAWNLYENGMHSKMIDETLDPSGYTEEEVKKVVEIALTCSQSPVSMRPTMSEVVVMLLGDRSEKQRPLSRQHVIDLAQPRSEMPTNTTGSSVSNATVSITEFSAR